MRFDRACRTPDISARWQVLRDSGGQPSPITLANVANARVHPGGCKHNEVAITHNVKQTANKGGTL
jgi:hypothetical protein